MDAHFRNAFTYRLTVTKVAVFSRADTVDDTGSCHVVFQAGRPGVELVRTQEGVHGRNVSLWIHSHKGEPVAKTERPNPVHREARNKGKLVGQKTPLKPKDIWAIRIHLQNVRAVRDLAMLNLAIDSKLRGRDLVSLRVRDVRHGNQMLSRAMVVQRKRQRPVQFELTEPTRTAVAAWIAKAGLRSEAFLFPSRLHQSPHVSTRQYARIVEHWVVAAGLDPSAYGKHSMRRTKATLIYKRTKNLPAVQLLLGRSKLESTVWYLGIEVDDALEISEQIEI